MQRSHREKLTVQESDRVLRRPTRPSRGIDVGVVIRSKGPFGALPRTAPLHAVIADIRAGRCSSEPLAATVGLFGGMGLAKTVEGQETCCPHKTFCDQIPALRVQHRARRKRVLLTSLQSAIFFFCRRIFIYGLKTTSTWRILKPKAKHGPFFCDLIEFICFEPVCIAARRTTRTMFPTQNKRTHVACF